MPKGDLVAPDVAFVRAEKLRESPRSYANIVPDLVVEVKSSTDSIKKLEAKIVDFLKAGVQVGILIDPDRHTVTVYRLNAEAIELTDGDNLTLPDLLPGWEIQVTELWPLVF